MQAQQLQAAAVALVAPKSAVSFPQVCEAIAAHAQGCVPRPLCCCLYMAGTACLCQLKLGPTVLDLCLFHRSERRHGACSLYVQLVEFEDHMPLSYGPCLLCLQTWRQQSWQHGAHDGVLVQVQALIPRRGADDTTDKGPRGSSDGGSSNGGAEAASSSSTTVLNKTWFIRLRPDKPPS